MALIVTGVGSLDPHLLDRLHEGGHSVRALLRVPEPVPLLHADAGAGPLAAGALRRLGGRGPRVVPADRVLVRGSRRRPRPARRRSSPTASATPASCSACSCSTTALGTLDMDRINAAFMATPGAAVSASLVGILLFIGACGKSAQIPLHVWLPDAMAGPTPVSALIHAATMVTAGVYLVARLLGHLSCTRPRPRRADRRRSAWRPRSSPPRSRVVQTDIKKVLAYSTISQLGFMFVALGVGAYGVGDLPPLHARVLQGVPVPRRRQRDPRARRRAGHPQDGRAREEDPGHLRDLRRRHRRDRGHPAARGLLLQGRDPVVRARERPRRLGRCSSPSPRSPRCSPRSTCSGCCGSRSSAARA